MISSPEAFHDTNKLRQVVLSDELKDWFHLTVLDEAHSVFTWGMKFRVIYDRVGQMRGFMPANSPILAATATCTAEIKRALKEKLMLKSDMHIENLGNFRANLQYEVYRMTGGAKSYAEIRTFFPSPDNIPQTLIFVDSIADTTRIVDTLREHFGWTGADKDRVQAYHSIRSEQGKRDTAEEFDSGACSIIVATESLTMVSCSGIHR